MNFYALLILLSKTRAIYFPFFVNCSYRNKPTVQETRHSSLPSPGIESLLKSSNQFHTMVPVMSLGLIQSNHAV